MYAMVLIVLSLAFKTYRATGWRRQDMAIVAIGSAVLARLGVAQIIKTLYDHPRPYWILENVQLLLAKEIEYSFPSGHTIFVFALAMGVYLYNKKVGRWFFYAAGLVGLARIFVGVHWPYDIIAGAVLGILTTIICHKIFQKYKHRLRF